MKGPKPIKGKCTKPTAGGKYGPLPMKSQTKKARNLGQTLKSSRFVEG